MTFSQHEHHDKPAPIDQSLIDAADWLVTLNSGETSAQELEDFQHWLQQHNNNQAYQALEKTWQKFELEQPTAAQQTISYALSNKPDHNTFANSYVSKTRLLSIGAIVSLVMFFAAQSPTVRFISADHYTLTDQTQSITLADNSKIQLPPRSAVNIHYSQYSRHIELVTGQVFIEVAKDADRPLTISSQHGSASALGTAFSVEVKDEFTQVKVIESTVKVCPKLLTKNANGRCEILRAGQQTQVTTQQVQPVINSASNMHIDWQKHTLTVDNQPLVTVLERLQQHYPGYIKYDQHALQSLTISGVFSLQKTQASLQLIATILRLNVVQYGGMVLVIKTK